MIEYPPSQFDDLTCFLSRCDELVRHDQATSGMPPTQQCLRPDNLPCIDEDDGLVAQLELLVLQRFRELSAVSRAAQHPSMKVVAVQLCASLSALLGGIKR